MRKIKALLQSFGRTNSKNECQHILFHIATIATPLEIHQLSLMDKKRFNSSWKAEKWKRWINTVLRLNKLAQKNQPEPFVACQLEDGVTKYAASLNQKHSKKLIFVLKGNADALMMPFSVLLNHLNARQVDVVVFSTKQLAYVDPFEIPGHIFELFLAKVRGILEKESSFSGLAILGTSFGALPAIIIGEALGASHIMAAGTGSPYSAWWLDTADFDPVAFLKERSSGLKSKTTLVYGGQSNQDITYAREINELVPVSLRKINRKNGKPVGHICLPSVVEEKKLTALFAESLGL